MENKLNSPEVRKILKLSVVFLVILSVFVAMKALSEFKEYRFIGSDIYPQNIISVYGEGEIFVVPDIATFSFTITEERSTAEEVQAAVTERMNGLLESLKADGIEDKDIKTIGYNLSPRYEYPRTNQQQLIYPSSGSRVLAGYELSHTVSLKIRDLGKVGEIVGKVGQMNVNNISSLSFSVDDEDESLREARKMAIEDAKEKAKTLSKDLGVRLVRITNFSESGPIYPYGRGGDFATLEASVPKDFPAPELPSGENRITSQVYISYEIK